MRFLVTLVAIVWPVKKNGKIIDTGAAALFMKIGLFFLAVGSTGIGNRLSHKQAVLLRIIAILLSPVVVFGSCLLFGMLTSPLFSNSSVWYAQQEAPIAFAAIVYLAVGFLLFRNYQPVAR